MPAKDAKHNRCTLIVITDGFDETETITYLSLLRRAGLCVKSVGLTSGLVASAHGVKLVPDLALADIDGLADSATIGAVILPEGGQTLSRLESDPRVHRLLRQVAAQGGQIVISSEGLRVVRAAAVQDAVQKEPEHDQRAVVLVRQPGQSPKIFARDLAWKLKQQSRL